MRSAEISKPTLRQKHPLPKLVAKKALVETCFGLRNFADNDANYKHHQKQSAEAKTKAKSFYKG